MLKKLNLKLRAGYYLGVLLFIAGLIMMPPHLIVSSMLNGAITFLASLIAILPLTLIALHFHPSRSSLFGIPDKYLSIILGLLGLALLITGIVRLDSQMLDWGTFIILLSGELRLQDSPGAPKEAISSST